VAWFADCPALIANVYFWRQSGRSGDEEPRTTRSVLITGTSKGIGYETALAFSRAGFRVHATMRNPSSAPGLSEIAAREKLPITVTSMDVDSDEPVQTGFAAIEAQHGPVDVLVTGASGIGCLPPRRLCRAAEISPRYCFA
jgi:NAD(P)-dependent dehydrogenase (short-subunit alcohol dehydrogenase family)